MVSSPSSAPIQLTPGSRTFATLAEAQRAFVGLKVPRVLPAGAKLVLIYWQFPPDVEVEEDSQGIPRVQTVNYNVEPSITKGHVQLVFQVGDGTIIVDQGRFASFNPATNKQFGPPDSRRLANGRLALTQEIQDPKSSSGVLRAAGWAEQDRAYQIAVISDILSINALITLLNSA